MQVAVLSPHRDDAAFSCGLLLQSLLRTGNILTIVNICTISRYAPYFIETSGNPTQQVTELRQEEDAAFVEKLRQTSGAENGQVALVDLTWQDVPLRWNMQDKQALAPLDLKSEEVRRLVNAFFALPLFDIVLVPMALGDHIDHRLVLRAAEQAFAASSLVFYEDLPYACRMPASEGTSGMFLSHLPQDEVWLPLEGASEGLKLEYARCYPSQIAIDVAEEMERYAKDHDGREHFFASPQARRKLMTAMHYEVAQGIA